MIPGTERDHIKEKQDRKETGPEMFCKNINEFSNDKF